MNRIAWWALLAVAACGAELAAGEAAFDEFKVKREAVYEFAEAPVVTRDGDQIGIAFESKGFCDVTVVLEDADGRIVRHLASGVLGDNAPTPFQKSAKAQRIVWDGKDDLGKYVDDKNSLTVRVSLGLKPQFEKNLDWSPYKRVSAQCPLLAVSKDGVYVYEGEVVDSLRCFSHGGAYTHTVYPFGAKQLAQVQGLHEGVFPQDGARLPLKEGFHQSTLLSSGTNAGFDERKGYGVDKHNNHHGSVIGNAAHALAAGGGRIALARLCLNRLAEDGTTGRLPLPGPNVTVPTRSQQFRFGKETFQVSPWSAAVSPDGKWIYFSGYAYRIHGHWDCLDVVMRMPFDGEMPPEVFAGDLDSTKGSKKEGSFRGASSVACDAQGRVYVSDYTNDRVQVFDASGKFLKAIPSQKPASVKVDHKTGEIYTFSWLLHCRHFAYELAEREKQHQKPYALKPKMRRFRAFDDPKPMSESDLPLPDFAGNGYQEWASIMPGPIATVEVDGWTEPPTIWLGRMNASRLQVSGGHMAHGAQLIGAARKENDTKWGSHSIVLMQEKNGKLEPVRNFEDEVKAAVLRSTPPKTSRQRLYVHPVTGRLYVGEGDSGIVEKAVQQLLWFDPDSDKKGLLELPLSSEDLAFDREGRLYCLGFTEIGRFEFPSMREVPWDYGEERSKVAFGDGRTANLMAGLVLPHNGGLWHRPGFGINARGDIAIGSLVTGGMIEARVLTEGNVGDRSARNWMPPMYPGRIVDHRATTAINIWNRHGELIKEDAVPGLGVVDGIGLDEENNLYCMLGTTRMLDGKPFVTHASGTMACFPAGRAKLVTSGKGAKIPLPKEAQPDRKPDLDLGGDAWVEGAGWLYGGVGWAGGMAQGSSGCCCWNNRFAFDYLRRSFVPETSHYSVAVLDANGNLIARVGRFGNADDGLPFVKETAAPEARSIGGDEVALFHNNYVGTFTDRRLFIADGGNFRILSVKLGYETEAKVALKDVPEAQEK